MNKKKMSYKGFNARIMEAERLRGSRTFGLPPGKPLDVYYVDEFLEPKENWMKGPGAFVVPVIPDKGLWFDWRENDGRNTAVVPTVKGCNPITGLQTSGFHLEHYEDKCPKHECDFMADRFCPECDYNWPDRNYCSQNPLWWDGYRVGDSVRQFFFTSDQELDIAPRLIGKENTIPAFGFAFYKPKKIREPEQDVRCVNISLSGGMSPISDSEPLLSSFSPDFSAGSHLGGPISPPQFQNKTGLSNYSDLSKSMSKDITIVGSSSSGISGALSRKAVLDGVQKDTLSRKELVEVSIGAGAKIKQSLNKDPYPLESWKEIPSAVMTIYFIFHNEFKELRAKGMRDLSGKSEGMLEGLPVG